MFIDITFDFRTDSKGKDPDSHSPTLRSYHQHLWSKALPTEGSLILDDKLNNTSDAGGFFFSSDSIIHTFCNWKSYQHIIRKIGPAVIQEFMYKSYTIGGMLVFPRNRINGMQTINGARGTDWQIRDRIDLTLECIRKYYLGERSPLYECFSRYDSFFKLFGSFRGYVDFFLLDDLINTDESIKFFHPFEKFGKNVLPATPEEYLLYRDNCIRFVDQRNSRIDHCYNGTMTLTTI